MPCIHNCSKPLPSSVPEGHLVGQQLLYQHEIQQFLGSSFSTDFGNFDLAVGFLPKVIIDCGCGPEFGTGQDLQV